MSTTRLPDAMPDVEHPTLLVVCDSHQCRIFDVGGHTIVEKETVESREPVYTDRQDRKPGPSAFGGKGGSMMGVGETDQVDEHRLKEFANTLVKHLDTIVRNQAIGELHLSAPAKFLSVIRSHLTGSLNDVTEQTVEGNFVKEAPLDILIRFRPDLKASLQKLRNEENFSPRKLPPK